MTQETELDLPVQDVVEENAEPFFSYFVATAQVLYERNNQLKQRMINVILELAEPQITRAVIQESQRAAMGRLQTELNVNPESVKDIVWFSFSFLGQMTQSTFNAQPQSPIMTTQGEAGEVSELESAAPNVEKIPTPKKKKQPKH